MRARRLLACVLGAGLFFLGLPVSAAEAAVVATYAGTVGGPGHASIYPSGLDVGTDGTVYVADTGGDQVVAYAPGGSELWRVGVRGPKTLQTFADPRDVAYFDGKLYVGDTGNRRVVVLDAATGTGVSQWASGFGTILGMTAGVNGVGDPIILVTQDNFHNVRVMTPTGGDAGTVGSGPGSAPGQLNLPRDAATDSAGNIYVADYLNDRVVKFTAGGVPLGGWGSKGTAAGQFNRPYGVAVDEADVVYVADSNNNRVQKFDRDGVFLGSMGVPGNGPGQLTQLRRVAVGAGSNPAVYGADLWGYRVERFTASGTPDQVYGGTAPPDGFFNEPSGVSVGPAGRLFVMDSINQRVQRFNPGGAFETKFGGRGWGVDLSGMAWARDVAVDQVTAKVWVADTKNSRVTEFNGDGSTTGRSISGKGVVYWPQGVTIDGSSILVADTGNNRVRSFDPTTGQVIWTATGFNQPNDVAVAGGIAYVTDTLGKRVVKLNAATGEFIAAIGQADLHYPTGVVVEPNGNVLVTDTSWNRIVELSPTGTRLKVIGSRGSDPGQFNYPTKLDLASGRLYVADQWNDRVQLFDLS